MVEPQAAPGVRSRWSPIRRSWSCPSTLSTPRSYVAARWQLPALPPARRPVGPVPLSREGGTVGCWDAHSRNGRFGRKAAVLTVAQRLSERSRDRVETPA